MAYTLEETVGLLKDARRKKGLSQRALSATTGLTQAHISKIENGTVDIRLSNLIELARALDLEVMLVPRNAVPVVRGLGRIQAEPATASGAGRTLPAYRLDEDGDDG